MPKFSTARLAPLDAPILTGDARGVTAAPGDADTTLATTAFVAAALGGATGGAKISDTPPASPAAGQLWWESDTGTLWVFFDDGNTTQWVAVGGGGSAAQPTRVLLSNPNITGAQANNFGPLTSEYDYYEVDGMVFSPDASSLYVRVSTDNGASYLAANYWNVGNQSYTNFGGSQVTACWSTSTSQFHMNPAGQPANSWNSFNLIIRRPWLSNYFKWMESRAVTWDGSNAQQFLMSGAYAGTGNNAAITHLQFIKSTATPYSDGYMRLYGHGRR